MMGGCYGCETAAACPHSLRDCLHSRQYDGWTYQPERDVILDGDGGIVIEIDPDVTTSLTIAERTALGIWIAQGDPAVIAAAGERSGKPMSRAAMAALAAVVIGALAAPAHAAPPSGLTLCRGNFCMEDRGSPSPGHLVTYGVDFEVGDRGFAAIDCVERIIAVTGAQTEFVIGSLPDLLCRLRGYETPAQVGAAAGDAEDGR